MKFIIYDKTTGNQLAELLFDNEIHHVIGNDELARKIADIVRGGVSLLTDIATDDARWIVNEPIPPTDIRFPIAVVDNLRRRGYRVEEAHPEIEAQFESLIAVVPKDAPLAQSVRVLWGKMSYLEKTDFLGTVQREFVK